MNQIKKRYPFDTLGSGTWLALCLLFSAIAFSLILILRVPGPLRTLSILSRSGFGWEILGIAILIYLLFKIPGRWGDMLSMIFALTLFVLPLAGLWAGGQSQSTVLNGIIPLYDAGSYFTDAIRVTEGLDFSDFSARRPLFPGLLSFLLAVTDYNLAVSLAFLTWIAGMSCYLTTREIQRTHGAAPATLVWCILFLFFRQHSGVSMSENLGMALGTLGFGLLWRAASTKTLSTIWLGLFTITLALNARAGAFFVLPFVLVWAVWLLRGKSTFSWRIVAVGLSAIVLGFGINILLTQILSSPSGVPFANFSYSLYGLASGGKSWTYVFEVHPELRQIVEPNQSREIYRLAFDLIRLHPAQAIQGALFNWRALFSDSWYNVYSYVGGDDIRLTRAARWSMYILCLLGIWSWARKSRDPYRVLVLVSALGVFLSVPFLPPTDAFRMRPYAASIIILASLPAMGLYWLTAQIKRSDSFRLESDPTSPHFMGFFAIFLLALTVFGPLGVKLSSQTRTIKLTDCKSPSAIVITDLGKSALINIRTQDASFTDWLPNYHFRNFRSNSHGLANPKLIEWAFSVSPRTSMAQVFDWKSNKAVMVLFPTDPATINATTVQLCGKYEPDAELWQFNIFYVDEVI